MRHLPKLLYVTDENALGVQTGDPAGVTKLLAELRPRLLSVDAKDKAAGQVAGDVRTWLAAHPGTEGVVLVGGYSVLPAQRLGCIPPGVQVSADHDRDAFIVWNDDVYGDTDGDGAPELPVSRVPDARSLAFLARVLDAKAPAMAEPFGLRSKLRPFADEVFATVSTQKMQTSAPQTAAGVRALWDGKPGAYFVLHGRADDPGRFLGENDDNTTLDALAPKAIPNVSGGVIFAACCWGALIVDTAAVDARPGASLKARTPETSIALRVLDNGANAFVGSTGLHYSPTDKIASAADPYGYLGKPLHAAFFAATKIHPPARALFEAKMQFAKGIPHALHSAIETALECKILHEFTCLGLGW
jgi:hypothetical protein